MGATACHGRTVSDVDAVPDGCFDGGDSVTVGGEKGGGCFHGPNSPQHKRGPTALSGHSWMECVR